MKKYIILLLLYVFTVSVNAIDECMAFLWGS